MKQGILIIVCLLIGAGGAVLWMKRSGAEAKAPDVAAAKPAEEEASGPQMSRDTNGNVVITITDEMQGDIGILVKKPAAAEMSPEMKGYGRVLDPAPLAALVAEWGTAEAAYSASSNELARLKFLEGQGNASARAIQTAAAAAQRDQLAVQAAKDKISLAWGKNVTEQKDRDGFVQSLISQSAALVRIDVAAMETITNAPAGARVTVLSGRSAEADFLGAASTVDPQLQGQGFLFLVRSNTPNFRVGEMVTGFLKVAGQPRAGVIIPRDAVVRTAGASWVYVANPGGEVFTRTEISLENPVEAGWFVTKGVTAEDYIIVTGAQQLLSFELKGQGGE